MTRVAITTDRFESAAAPFASLGLDPVPVPCIRVETSDHGTLAAARAAASRADLILITSARTVELLWAEEVMPEVAVAAVGSSTARAVTDAGGRVVATGISGLAGLVESIADRLPRARVAIPHSSGSDPVALARLRKLAPTLEEIVVYRTVPTAAVPIPVDAVVFSSPSAVDGWLLSRDLDRLVVGVIGQTTGAVVARHRPPDVTAPQPSNRALARALMSYLEVTV